MKTLAGKVIVTIGVFLVIVAAVQSIRGVLQDRLRYRAEALRSVGESLAGPQRLGGVVLVLPYVERVVEEKVGLDGTRRAEERVIRHAAIVLPERLDVEGTLAADQRRRGLFAVNGYVWTGTLRGTLRLPDVDGLPRTRPGAPLQLGVPRAVVTVGDVRGLRTIAIAVAGIPLTVDPGTPLAGEREGVSAEVHAAIAPGATVPFEASLELAGADRFEVLPLGRETEAHVTSRWPHPSFTGRFLPVERRVSAQGFDARWRTTAFATTAREAWLLGANPPADAVANADRGDALAVVAIAASPHAGPRLDTFQVSLIDPVDIYALTDRATKYALLFVVLTLGMFALYEALRRMNVHPLQYLFVGAALAAFFLLLLALAEHVGFAWAYVAASGACVTLLAVYVGGVLRSRRRGVAFGGGVAALYAALYGIVQSEQNALLLGTLLVFGVLAGAMLLTRHVDWYRRLRAAPPVGGAGEAP
jgi:inner membrane protein